MKIRNEKGKVYAKTPLLLLSPSLLPKGQQKPAVIICQQRSWVPHAKHTEHKRLDESCLVKL